MVSRFHNDQPITGEEGSEDLLNRKTLSQQLASILLQDEGDECLTVSIEGPWGYGKTSVINLIKGQLSDRAEDCIIIEHNPWISGDNESLIQDFLLQFSAQVGARDHSEDAVKAAKELVSYSSLFSAAKLVPGAEPWASIIEGVFKQTGKSVDSIAKLKKLSLVDRKKIASDKILRINKPIIVIIDDIDRLTPSEAFQVLRLVKGVADFPRTAFVLAYDPKYLSKTLTNHGIENTSEYLDKIVQLRVPLPVVSYEGMEEIARSEFSRIIGENDLKAFENDADRLSWLYQQYFRRLVRSPRELKRFFNHFDFVYQQVKGEVCISDLFGLSLIAIKANSVYEDIKKYPEFYIGEALFDTPVRLITKEERIKAAEAHRGDVLKDLTVGHGDFEQIIGLLGEVFPDFNPEGVSLYRVADADQSGRVAAPERLYTALHYKTPKSFVSDQLAIDFLRSDNKDRHLIESIVNDDKLERFMALIIAHAPVALDKDAEVPRKVSEIVVQLGYLQKSFPGGGGILSFDFFRSIFWYCEKVIKDIGEKDFYLKCISESLYCTPILVQFYYSHKRDFDAGNGEYPWLEKLRSLCVENSISSLRKSIFSVSGEESKIFNFLLQNEKDKVKELLNEILGNEKGIFRIAEFFAITGSDSEKGAYVSVDVNKNADIWDPAKIRQLSESALDVNLPFYTQAALLSLIDGSKRYLIDASKGVDW